MMAPTLETLPIIVLERICEYLAQDDPTLRTIHYFSLASRSCCSVAEKQRFSQIHIVAHSPSKLEDSKVRLARVLRIGKRRHFVRRLKISCISRKEIEANLLRENRYNDHERRDVYFDVHPFCRPYVVHPRVVYYPDCVIRRPEHIRAFAHFIRQLSHLEDLVWADMTHMPPPILSSIHAIGCRLHVHALKVECFGKPWDSIDQPSFIGPDQIALMTSPCLYSIVALYQSTDCSYLSPRDVLLNQQALNSMINGVAPNLAHVQVHELDWRGCLSDDEDEDATPNTEEPIALPEVGEVKLGALQSLVIDVVHYDNYFKSYETNLSKLRALAIDLMNEEADYPDETTIRYLAQAAVGGIFESLHTLALSILQDDDEDDTIHKNVILLLEHLNPLMTLDLTGFVSKKTYEAALRRHGATLRRLRICPRRWMRPQVSPRIAFSEAVVQRLADQCPKLEQLEIPINRTQGNAHETRIYRALSRIPQLTRVSLILETSLETIQGDGEEIFDELDDREGLFLRPGYNEMPLKVRDALMNVAIDASLARSIYDLISPEGRLSRLELWSWDKWGPIEYEPGLETLLRWVGRNWFVEKDYRGEPSVREIGGVAKAGLQREVERLKYQGCWLVWILIWPQTAPDWWRHWKSFPLSED